MGLTFSNHRCREEQAKTQNNEGANTLTDNLNSSFCSSGEKKFWVDASGSNKIILFPKDLEINWGNDPRFWRWSILEGVEVAELLGLSWFQIDGRIDASSLTQGVVYQVVLVMRLKEWAYGWDFPIQVGISISKLEEMEHQEILKDMRKEEWIEVLIGEFTACGDNQGDVHFYLVGKDGGLWKGGLLVKEVLVRPKDFL